MTSTHTRVPAPAAPVGSCPVRDVLERVGDKWSVLLVTQMGPAPQRFSALLRATDGLSQRMLTRTLRLLERDGLVAREVRPTTPPQVSYSLTPLGRSLAEALELLTRWALDHREEVALARSNFDARDLLPGPGTGTAPPARRPADRRGRSVGFTRSPV